MPSKPPTQQKDICRKEDALEKVYLIFIDFQDWGSHLVMCLASNFVVFSEENYWGEEENLNIPILRH